VQKSDITKAKKFIAGEFLLRFGFQELRSGTAAASPATTNSALTLDPPPVRKKKAKTAPDDMDPAKAHLLVETICLNATRNRMWQNQPLEKTKCDCILAERPHPCSLCAQRANISVTFPPCDSPHPAFPIPPAPSKRASVSRALKVKKKERPVTLAQLSDFGTLVFRSEMHSATHLRRVKSWFFPPSLQEKLADSILQLSCLADLNPVLAAHDWPFRFSSHRYKLWLVIRCGLGVVAVATFGELRL
jgi:hypothetical protein